MTTTLISRRLSAQACRAGLHGAQIAGQFDYQWIFTEEIMKGIAIVVLFVFMLAGSAFAGNENAKDASSSNHGQFSVENSSQKRHKHYPSVALTGVMQFAAWATRKDITVIAPKDQTGQVEARLTFGPGPFATLYTKETYEVFGMVREMNWKLVIERDGKVKTSFPLHAKYTYSDGSTEEDDNTVASHAEMTGCPEYGAWPIFYGHFDGERLDIATEQQGVCTGGTLWKDWLGVSEEMGPLHVDVLLSLEVTE
jgi:hypothetical protein